MFGEASEHDKVTTRTKLAVCAALTGSVMLTAATQPSVVTDQEVFDRASMFPEQPVVTATPELVSVDSDGTVYTAGATGPSISVLGDRVGFSNQALGIQLMFHRDRVATTTQAQLLGAGIVAMSGDGCVVVATLDVQHSIWDTCAGEIWSAPQNDDYPPVKSGVSHDGSVVVLPAQGHVKILRRADGYATTGPETVPLPQIGFRFARARYVSVSDDANQIAVVADEGDTVLRFGTTPDMVLYYRAGAGQPMIELTSRPFLASPSWDGAGRWLAYEDDQGVKVFDRVSGDTVPVVPGGRSPSMSRDGRHLTYVQPGVDTHIYVATRLGTTWEASLDFQWVSAGPGVPNALESDAPAVSEHGRWVAWDTSDTQYLGLVGGPTDGTPSVVVRERRPVIAVAGHDFGVTTEPVEATLAVTNTGPSGWRVTSVAVTGPFSLVSHNCPAVLHPGAACQAQVSFPATAIGTSTGSLALRDDSYPGISVAASGALVASVPEPEPPPDFGLSFSPNPVDFGTALVGTDGGSRVATLQNTGTDGLTVSSITVTGANASDFSIVRDECSNVILGAAATCSVEVNYRPGAVGPRFAVLSAAGSGNTAASTRLTGVGELPFDPPRQDSPPREPPPPTPELELFFPTLSVSPSSTPGGFVVVVAGVDYPPLGAVSISLGGADPISVATDESGSFELHWMILDQVSQGTYLIDDVATLQFDASAVELQVVSSPMRPQGVPPNARTIRRHVSR